MVVFVIRLVFGAFILLQRGHKDGSQKEESTHWGKASGLGMEGWSVLPKAVDVQFGEEEVEGAEGGGVALSAEPSLWPRGGTAPQKAFSV